MHEAEPISDVAERLAAISDRVAEAARRSGRTRGDIGLIAVSKGHGAEVVLAAARAGQFVFGENRVQEALDKQAALRVSAPTPAPLEWHLIGHLQSNKARLVPAAFAWIHSLDRLELARRLSEAAHAANVGCNALIQVNVADDPGKHGVAPGELVPLVESILAANLSGLSLRGLMTIGRLNAGETETRRAFARLRELRDMLHERTGLPGFTELSMGMSGDYSWAIAEGATMVRIGSALFGQRIAVKRAP